LAQQAVIEVSNIYFAMIFGVECIVRLLAHAPRQFFSSLWFCFDFFAVIMSFVVLGVEESDSDNLGVTVNPTILRSRSPARSTLVLAFALLSLLERSMTMLTNEYAASMFRIIKVIKTIRTLRLLKFLKGLNTILESLARSLPVVGYLAILYFILLFSFGVLGVVLVGNACSTYDQSLPGARATRCLLVDDSLLLEEFSSFRNMEMALLTLIRLTTGDGWATVLNKASVTVDGYKRKDGSLQRAEEALRNWNTTAPEKMRLREAFLKDARTAVIT
jgi:hypothetical protein